MKLTNQYWDNRYKQQQTGWDIGYISTPLKDYFDQLTNKRLKILIPGAGKGWEAEYLFKKGFTNTFMLDYSEEAIMALKYRFPDFPESNLICDDFFNHKNTYDMIVEQTFFCSLHPSQRVDYVESLASMLNPGGKVVGVLFSQLFDKEGPPFGGTKNEYIKLFERYFDIKGMDTAYNSIIPRQGQELFINLIKLV
ncbi:MAG: methyltransferase domain-containing protein [Bacteroidales bacterium]|nr:methyltransferase domain-containing protein [Bacteroidales bacterium]|tara:strand:- start:3484 stop:4068 length:585 start_codon:yes stop_codon:yes gene_type:complete